MGVILALALIFASTNHAQGGCASCGSDPDPEPTPLVDGYVLESLGLVGTLVRPVVESSDCRRLRIFFPGHAQELGYRGEVPFADERKWAEYLLGPGHYHLGPAIAKAGCPVLILGDSRKALSAEELDKLLGRLSLESFEVLAHSGGNVGLNASLSTWPPELTRKISGVALLDNFYSGDLARTLAAKIDPGRLAKICTGFLTDHNQARYASFYRGVCPKVVKKADHKSPVAAYFQ